MSTDKKNAVIENLLRKTVGLLEGGGDDSVEKELQSGKTSIAAAITSKGIPTLKDDSMADMATKIGQIPQVVNAAQSDFEQMIAPTPYMWNVYTVAQDLMKSELPSYLPSYMTEYKTRYGANSFFVGEYYLGYATLELTGADGYLTNDGDFYTISGGEVTHTKPDGSIETWTDTTIIHTWHDDDSYCNRWVAFFYLNDAYQFTNVTSSICPRRVALCGTCDSFIVSGANRLTDVWVIGTLGHFEGGATGTTWNPAQVIRNYKTHAAGAIYTNPTSVASIILPDLEDATNDIFSFSQSCPNLQFITLPKLKTLPVAGGIKIRAANLQLVSIGDTNERVSMHSTSGSVLSLISDTVTTNCKILLNSLVSVTSDERWFSFINISNGATGYVQIYLENLEELKSAQYETYIVNCAGTTSNIKYIYAPKLKKVQTHGLYLGGANYNALEDVVLGELDTNIIFSKWTATDVTTTAEGIAKINANIRNHIAARVADMTGQTSPTITFGANLYSNLEQATKDAFSAKNWTVASA